MNAAERPSGPREESYDVAVVGGGLGGLYAGALLASAGRKVLVADRQDGPGGYAHAFQRGDYHLDPAVHVTVEGHPGGPLDQVLSHLGVRDQVEIVRLPHVYSAAYPGLELHIPQGFEANVDAHATVLPRAREQIAAWFDLIARFFAEASQLQMTVDLRSLDGLVERFPTFFALRTATVADALDAAGVTDPQARAVLASSWPYLGLPPSQLSCLGFGKVLAISIHNGIYYVRGGFQKLADALVDALEAYGGEFLPSTEVTRILVEDGAVAGVELAAGTVVRAPVVISNADATTTLRRLVGEDHLPSRYLRRLARMKPSVSGFVVYAATDADVSDGPYESFMYTDFDHDRDFAEVHAGRPSGTWLTVPTVMDPHLAPAGQHLLIATSLAELDVGTPWEQLRDQFTAAMIARVEEHRPEVRGRVEVVDTATPVTLQRFGAGTAGALYGWASSPEQFGSKRLGHDTPIRGLWLSGHWAQQGPGSFGALMSGIVSASMILRAAGEPDALPDFRPADMPERLG